LFLTATKCVSVFFLLSTVWPELLLLLLLVLLDGLLRLWLTRCRRFTSAWSNKMIASDFLCKLLCCCCCCCCCSYCCCVVSWVMRIFFLFKFNYFYELLRKQHHLCVCCRCCCYVFMGRVYSICFIICCCWEKLTAYFSYLFILLLLWGQQIEFFLLREYLSHWVFFFARQRKQKT